jgi:hypothetical protein
VAIGGFYHFIDQGNHFSEVSLFGPTGKEVDGPMLNVSELVGLYQLYDGRMAALLPKVSDKTPARAIHLQEFLDVVFRLFQV